MGKLVFGLKVTREDHVGKVNFVNIYTVSIVKRANIMIKNENIYFFLIIIFVSVISVVLFRIPEGSTLWYTDDSNEK